MYDCVSFYSFIETVITANTPQDGKQIRQSQWLFLEAGNRVIETARKRVYVKKGDAEFKGLPKESEDPTFPPHIKLVLEEQPKWLLLKNVLAEIEQDAMSLNHGEGAPVLIMVNERRTCSQLKKYITSTKDEKFLIPMARGFFQWRSTMHKIQKNAAPPPAPAPITPQRRGGPPNKRRRIRGGSSTAASGPGRTGNLAEVFQEDVIETVSL